MAVTTTWYVKAEFTSIDDAVALIEIIGELGYKAIIHSRQIDNVTPRTPVRETRSGKLLLEAMAPGRSYHSDQLSIVLCEHGFAERTAATLLSILSKEGDVERIERGLYRRIK